MIRTVDIRIPIALIVNILWAMALSSFNSEIAPYVYIMLPALFVFAPAMVLGFWGTMMVVGISAICFEAYIPARTFMTCVLWLIAAFIVHGLRFRLRTLDAFSMLCFIEIANFLMIAIFAIFMPSDIPSFIDTLTRICVDMSASAIVLAAVGVFSYKLLNSVSNILRTEMSIGDDDK